MSKLDFFVLIMQSNMLFFGEIYTTGKDFTLPPAVTGVTNITSGLTHGQGHLLSCQLS